MDLTHLIFWNVDTQIDFVYPKGKLSVEGAMQLRPKWKELTKIAKDLGIRVVNTADYHHPNAQEFDPSPDFIQTFPEHCMANSRGAEYVRETDPEEPLIFNWDKEYLIIPELFDREKTRNIIIRKDVFDVFEGNPMTDEIIRNLHADTAVVYGVTTNVCVDYAVRGLVQRVKNVWVVEDAIKELPKIPLPYDAWKKKGVRMITLKALKQQLGVA